VIFTLNNVSQPTSITLIALDAFESAGVGPDPQKFKLLFGTVYDHCHLFLWYVRVKPLETVGTGGRVILS